MANYSLNDLMEACKAQADWMSGSYYSWQSNPTVSKSKYKGTCVTYVACVLQRLGVMPSGDYIWHENGRVYGNTSGFDVSYPGGQRLNSLKDQLQGGDIILDGDKYDNGLGSHIFILTGDWDGDNPIIWDNHSAQEGYGAYTYRRNRSVIAIVRIQGLAGSSSASFSFIDGIRRLYSSDNYKYVEQQENELSTAISKYKSDLQVSLAKTDFKTATPTTGAYNEKLVTTQVELANFEKDKPKKILTGKATSLLTYPTIVEAPTIVLDFNGIKIGGYGNVGDKYPNYITSMSVKKINGRINQYNINLSYQVRFGEDPNFIDKLISRTGYLNPLKILYGDSNYPSGYYREESAVIMNATHSEDVSAYRINYSITAISSIAASSTSLTTYPKQYTKPSTAIYDLLYNSGDISKSLISLFPGMRNKNLVASKNLIPTNDSMINIGGMENVSPLTYLSYLVACMNNSINNSSYYLSIVDNSYSEFNGSYFKINEIISYNNQQNSNVEINANYYELDIGFPSNNYITNFQICNNNYWSLVYDYTGDIPKFEYGIDDNGDLIERKTNILYRKNKFGETSLINSNWWKQVTEFPISAKVTIKGLINPAMLMSYIKVNALFYGERDMASGLYVVTAQEDSISGSGYTTELTLLRVAGD